MVVLQPERFRAAKLEGPSVVGPQGLRFLLLQWFLVEVATRSPSGARDMSKSGGAGRVLETGGPAAWMIQRFNG